MRQFYVPTEDNIKSVRTELSEDIATSTMAIPVKNPAQFRANKYLCITREGTERAELILITSVDKTNKILNLESPGTSFAHYEDEVCVQFDYNQRRLYKWSDLSDDWYHIPVESPRDIGVDNPKGTLFEDGDGGPEDKYCSTYYNQFTEVGTEPDDAKSVIGTESANLVSIGQFRSAAGMEDNEYIPDAKLDEIRQDAQGEVWAALRNRYSFPLTRKSSFLRRVVLDLCVGLLFVNEYGSQVENIALDGYRKLEDAREKLAKLASGDYTLYDEIEDEDNTLSTRDTISFYPDNTAEDEDEDIIFRIDDEF